MTSALLALFIIFSSGVVLWFVSLILEAMRPVPTTPTTLRWAPDIPIRYIKVRGSQLRYISAGTGPSLVLLHTLHTQLDLFEKVVPDLAKHFTVYALDYPDTAIRTFQRRATTPTSLLAPLRAFSKRLIFAV